MNGWQIAVIIIWALGMGIEMANHGKAREGNHNFFFSLVSNAIMITLLIKAGLFN